LHGNLGSGSHPGYLSVQGIEENSSSFLEFSGMSVQRVKMLAGDMQRYYATYGSFFNFLF